jgi:hypothetical protein
MRNVPAVLCSALLSLTLGLAATGRAETLKCTPITVLPATITQSGIYCLTSDLSWSSVNGVAVTINTNDVVLDLNGHTLDNLAAGVGTGAIGIAGLQRRDVVVKNGTIRGFTRAVQASDSSPYLKSQRWVIEDLRVDRSTWNALQLAGRDLLVRRNVVMTTGGTTAYGANVDSHGILVLGPGNRVIDNDVITVAGQGTGSGIGIALGILSDGGIAMNNRVSDSDYGFVSVVNAVKFRDNLTTGVTTAFSGGTDAGNND